MGLSIDESVNTDNRIVSFQMPEDCLDHCSAACIVALEQYNTYLHVMCRNEVAVWINLLQSEISG